MSIINVGDMIRYHNSDDPIPDFQDGTIGIVLKINNDENKEHLGVRVYFQSPSRFNHYEANVRRDNIIPEKDWDKYFSTGSINLKPVSEIEGND